MVLRFACKPLLVFLLAVFGMGSISASAALIDSWSARDLNFLDNGDSVGAWASKSNRLASAPVGTEPRLKKNATPSGESSVEFNLNRMSVGSSPVANLNAFSMAVVFKVTAPGVDEGSGWSTKSGIVDGAQAGSTNDWGFAVRETGYVVFGTGVAGGSDASVYLDNQPTYPSVVDGNFHVVVCTWGGGSQTVYMDKLPGKTQGGVSTTARSDAGFSLGGIHSGEATRQFQGELCEVQFYNTALSGVEASNLIGQLSYTYLSNDYPRIVSFEANPATVTLGAQATLSWAVSNATRVSIDQGIGTVGATGSVQVLPTVSTTYTLTATNGAGPRTAQAVVTVDPGLPVANPQDLIVPPDLPFAITLTGQDPQGSPVSYAIVQSPWHGVLSGTLPNVVYTPYAGYAGPDAFTFKVNDGVYDSAPATVQIYVTDAARPPHALTLNTDTVDSGAAPGAFLGVFRASDTNRLETHTFALVAGPGSENNSNFSINGNRLLAGTGFPLVSGAEVSIRVRATDSTGLYLERVFFLKAEKPYRGIVINEIHYNPDQNTIREEFVELYNAGTATVNLSLWRLRGGIDYVIPDGTTLGAGHYLVVASAPSVIKARYNKTVLGPWTGNLSSDGERLTLRNALDELVDEVEYRSEFPWPVAANGNGPSMELIHPWLDNNLGSSWASSLSPLLPTPAAANRVSATNAAPNIRQVSHSPKQPASTNQVLVTAKVTDPQGVASVMMSYQVVAPGNYIPSYIPLTVTELVNTPLKVPSANPVFEAGTNWSNVMMNDDGVDGDAVAGDDIYSALVPFQANRTLVRYRITCADALGASRRAPFADDPSLNFAYFVYDGIPAYGTTSAEQMQALPVYFLLTRNADFTACTAYNGADQIPQFSGSLAHEGRYVFNWAGAFVYDGEVYDHIRYRLRGANGRYMAGKRNFRIRFNDGRYLAAKNEFGEPYPRKWSHLSTAKGASNRQTLTYSLNEYVSYLLLNKVGVPAPNSHFFHWRVIRGVQEAPDSYNGDFYGTSWAQEEYNAEFLESHGLPKGNLYKLINARRATDVYKDMVEQQRYQGPYAVTNGGDGVRIQSALLNTSEPVTDEWLHANVNYTNWYAYHTVCEAVRNYDTWPEANKNAAWFFDTDYTAENNYMGRFWTLPWDWTDTWGPTWNAGQDLAWKPVWGTTAFAPHTNMQREYRNTMREIRDLLFQPDQINPLIDAVAARLRPLAAADFARWAYGTPSGSAYSSLGAAGPGFSQGFNGYVQDLKNFMFVGGYASWWFDRSTVSAGGWITRLDNVSLDLLIPNRPTIYYVGQPGYPMNDLTFECLPFADPQGPGSFAGMQWRLAEVYDTNKPFADARMLPPMECDAVWGSGVLSTWSNRVTIPGTYVQAGKLYRARVRHLDNTGRWSRWSAPVEFAVTPVDVTAQLRAGLRITELMYNPPALGVYDGDELEFLELKNIGTEALDLGGFTFSGITFTFPASFSLEAGQVFLLGRNSAALQTKYPGLTVDGIYSGKLDNAGETIRLSTPSGVVVLEVTYEDSAPWPVTADGLGWSLVLADPVLSTYRSSAAAGGSPGAEDPVSTIPGVVISEVLTHTDPPLTDTIEIFNPTGAEANIGGWYLTDDAAFPWKFRIPNNTKISAGGYLAFREADFNQGANGFGLSSLGDEAYLFAGEAPGTNITGYAHGATFGASKNGVSFGRYLNSAGEEDFVALTSLTLGTNNARPTVGPVVISEIMFQPPVAGTNEPYEAEFVELSNVTTTNVPLYDPGFPGNTWRLRNGIDFDFPAGVVLAPDSRLVVVSFDPAQNPAALGQFRATYGLGEEVPVVGPWIGRLSNGGEAVELKSPDAPELDGFVPYVMVEKIHYRPVAPWPSEAAGTGLALHRATLLAYGNDPTNWFAGVPTPGALSPETNQDFDGDGVPDQWESTHGTDPLVADGGADPDGDRFTNLQEWLAGTDPQDANDYLRLEAEANPEGSITLRFKAAAGRSYQLVSAPVADAIVWFPTAVIGSAPTNRVVEIQQPVTETRYFRVSAP